MTRYDAFEVKAASLLMGVLLLALSLVIGLDGSRDALHYILARKGMDEPFGVTFFCLSLMVMYGAMKPKRKCRHIGLALSGMLLAVVFGEILKAQWLTVSTGLVIVLLGACFVVLIADIAIGSGERRTC